MPRLAIEGSTEEIILFRLIGVMEAGEGPDTAKLVGTGPAKMAEEQNQLYVKLPNPDDPEDETRRLAEALGRAVGLGRVRL